MQLLDLKKEEFDLYQMCQKSFVLLYVGPGYSRGGRFFMTI